MPYYRGVDQNEVAQSIETAVEFLTGLNIGPECNKLAASVTEGNKLENIRNAQTDAKLVTAVNESGAASAFIRLANALYYHAHANTDGKGLDALKGLAKWGAIGGARDMALHPSDMEINDHLNELPAIENIYAPIPGVEYPFDMYGLTVKNASVLSKEEASQLYQEKLAPKVQEILEPFFAKNEVRMVGVGLVGEWRNTKTPKTGVVFEATREAAQAVADAFPEHDVINSRDETVSPEKSTHADRVNQGRTASGEALQR